MNRLRSLLFLWPIATGFIISACASLIAPSSSTETYSEDLSIWRPKYDSIYKDTIRTASTSIPDKTVYVPPRHSVNDSLESVLDSIDHINLAKGYVEGHTILIYTGTSREEALNAKKVFDTSLPQMQSELKYIQPNYRVLSGSYYTRQEAQKDFTTIRRYFRNAIVIPERFRINP